MEWTPEAVQAEVDRRHELAQQNLLAKQLREARPSWWRRLRSHGDPDHEHDDGDQQAA